MKKIVQIIALSACSFFVMNVSHMQAQTESLRDRLVKKQQQQQGTTIPSDVDVPRLSVRAEMMNENQTQDLSNATWIREIYRYLDLNKGKNAALYYPEQPVGNKMNLFTMIFKLMASGNLTAYEFNDGKDLFTDKLKINFGDVLDRLEIPFQKNGNAYVFDEFSIPANEAKGYYIKEAWYFDQSNSVLGVKTVAICPVLFRQDFSDFSAEAMEELASAREPQFWIPYENIRPYAARMPIMTSDKNNVMSKTIDDYFRLRLYDGEIYKATNMEGKFLVEKYKTPETLDKARKTIEGELKQFEENLWVANDSINMVDNKTDKKIKASKAKKQSQPKASKASKPKSSTKSSFSARDRR